MTNDNQPTIQTLAKRQAKYLMEHTDTEVALDQMQAKIDCYRDRASALDVAASQHALFDGDWNKIVAVSKAYREAADYVEDIREAFLYGADRLPD